MIHIISVRVKSTAFYVLAAVIGLLCGILSNHGILRGSWWNLAFWNIVGMVIGFFASDDKEARWSVYCRSFSLDSTVAPTSSSQTLGVA